MKKLIIVGTGETANIAYEYFSYDSEYKVEAFSVENQYLDREIHFEKPVTALETLEQKYSQKEYEVFVALSSNRLNRNRERLYNIVKRKGYTCASYISSKAFVWRDVEIGENCFIFENNTLQPFVKIGNNVILWSGNHIGHSTIIKDNSFISSHCVISGYCEIGENSFLGVNCTLEDNVKIGKDNFIGASSLIQKNTKENSLYQSKETEISKVDTHRLFKIEEDE